MLKNGRSGGQTFAEASKKIQENLQRHLDRLPSTERSDNESSDDEGNQDSSQVLDSVFSSYDLGGQTGRTADAIKTLVTSGTSCLICISTLKRQDAVWSCDSCFCSFHLNCVQQWANDCIFQQKNQLEDGEVGVFQWACPKCRTEREQIPRKYTCYCGKVDDPVFDPWIVPHSCGETCKLPLKPKCGHQCLILCHPGPCPPCPKTVKIDCYCKNSAPAFRRCFEKHWSCGKPCRRSLNCGQHKCPLPCHDGECQPCQKTSVQLCQCQRHQKTCDCATPVWKCDEVCGKPLGCGHHVCDVVCHGSGPCPPCPLSLVRSCPCGKTQHKLPCYDATPTCGNTCGKPLACADHTCVERCHRGKCGSCLQMAKKSCRCGAKLREIACAKKEFTCDTKCKKPKACGKHACNRKCCETATCPPPCDLPCNKLLSCKNHKCPSRCHPSRCYPCNQTKEVACKCGSSRVLVPCGMEKSTKPPKCKSKCKEPTNCHHSARLPHNCHFENCPPCRQQCMMDLPCGHTCPAPCHDNVEVKTEISKKAATPWEAANEGTLGGVRREIKALACPDCQVPVPTTCLGGHDTSDWPCYLAKAGNCGRACGRSLPCGNHQCERSCHKVKNAPNELDCGSNCRKCESACLTPRPEGCHHPCLKPCHPGDCDKCPQMIRIRCHCGISQLYVKCGEWCLASQALKLEMACCKDQCPKQLECGHRCSLICHQGPCLNKALCKKKVKAYCSCKRVKRDVQCNKSSEFIVNCDDECLEIKKVREFEKAAAKEVTEQKLAVTADLQDVPKRGKRYRNRRRFDEQNQDENQSFFTKNRTMIFALLAALASIIAGYFMFNQ